MTNWSVITTEDFRLMHKMLNEIELKLMGVDGQTQYEFYRPIKNMLFEAWSDTCNPNDPFLYPHNPPQGESKEP